MIYYICIVNPTEAIDTVSVSQVASNSMSYHASIGHKAPNLMNEPCMFVAINNRTDAKKLKFTENDVARISIYSKSNHGYARFFDITEFSLAKEIFDELRTQNVKIDSKVVYV